jgi:fatty-acyl-CoA synthase
VSTTLAPAWPHRARATTLADLLDRAADKWEHEALVLDGERLSFSDFSSLAHARARELRGLGVGPGECVGLLMPNSVDYLVSIFAAAKIGAVAVPINHRFSVAELAHVVADAELAVVLVADATGGRSFVGTLAEALGRELAQARDPAALALTGAPRLRQVVRLDGGTGGGMLSRDRLAARGADVDDGEIAALQAAVSIRDRAMIVYTSGTTAKPKGCVLNGEGLTRTAFAVADERFLLGPEVRFWDPLPFCHLSSLVILNACLAAGATFVSMARFDAGEALALLAAERCTHAYPCFDTVSSALQEHPDFEATDLSELCVVVTIGVPEKLRALQDGWPQAVQLGAYGATEYSGVLCFNRVDDDLERRIETCGPPIPGMEIRIVDRETGAELGPGERGELLCRGYGVFEGYHRDPEQTAKVLGEDGWVRSGDLVSVDADGYVSYHGRLKDMLKVGGENVAAAEIEGVLLTHPDVREAQVVAAPDAKYVEVPAAFVELRDGAGAGADELVAFCDGQLATFKVPRYVRFVEEWPMSGTKIMKLPLRERIAAELAAEG